MIWSLIHAVSWGQTVVNNFISIQLQRGWSRGIHPLCRYKCHATLPIASFGIRALPPHQLLSINILLPNRAKATCASIMTKYKSKTRVGVFCTVCTMLLAPQWLFVPPIPTLVVSLLLECVRMRECVCVYYTRNGFISKYRPLEPVITWQGLL